MAGARDAARGNGREVGVSQTGRLLSSNAPRGLRRTRAANCHSAFVTEEMTKVGQAEAGFIIALVGGVVVEGPAAFRVMHQEAQLRALAVPEPHHGAGRRRFFPGRLVEMSVRVQRRTDVVAAPEIAFGKFLVAGHDKVDVVERHVSLQWMRSVIGVILTRPRRPCLDLAQIAGPRRAMMGRRVASRARVWC